MILGGFPTNTIEKCSLSTLRTSVMEALYDGYRYKSVETVCDALQPYVDIDLYSMYEADFLYLLASIDKTSYPESFRVFEWRCQSDREGSPCNTLNTETVRFHKVVINPLHDLPEGLALPKISSFDAAYGKTNPMYQAARWIDSDLPYDELMKVVKYNDLLFAAQHMYSSADQVIHLTCSRCMSKHVVKKPIDPISFLRTYSPASMMNMTLNLAASLKTYMPDDMPLQKLLYWHSCWEKDKNEAEQQRRTKEARNGRK